MSSLAAAKADNFYYPPDFDPQKHKTLNKYNGQHPLRERAAKIDQGILVIRFEVPFNIWCDKCGEHIAKGERFNAEKKAIGNYYSTKILQFSMTHHCGCKITIQTDPKNAEYLVVEGARKKVETYSAADAGVYELPDEQEKEKRERDPFYRLEYQQDAKKKALSSAERLAVLHDIVDDRTADPYAANKAARAALRAAKKADAVLDVRRAALGLPGEVRLLPEREGDRAAAEIAFLASGHARAAVGSEERRKVILDQDIFASGAGSMKAGAGSGATVGGTRPVLPGTGGGVVAGPGGGVRAVGLSAKPVAPGAASYATVVAAAAGKGGLRPAGASGPGSGHGQGHGQGPVGQGRAPGGECGDKHSKAGSGSGPGTGAGASGHDGKADGGPGSRRPGPGAAALAAAAAMAKSARGLAGLAHGAGVAGTPGGAGAGLRLGGGAGGGAAKRSLKDKAAELRKRHKGPGGVGLAGPLG